ncbi:MAG: hypothetical protein WDM87_09580 [Terracidiphilus sp.]
MKNSFAVTGLPMEGTHRQSAKMIVAMFAGLFLLSTGISGCFGMISGCISSMANGEAAGKITGCDDAPEDD